MDLRFTSFEALAPVVREHEVALTELQKRVRMLEKMLDTRATPLWRRVLFRIDGWPSWSVVAHRPAWRPWRRRWTS